jgi:predicted DNA binding CopG/RHH family protein
MKKRIDYTDEPIGKVRVIKDFLPPPSELALKDEGVKVTMTLSKSSVQYFKKAGQKYRTPYQKMIRRLLDAYASQHPRL